LYFKLYFSNQWRLTPFIWTGYNNIIGKAIIPILGTGLQYRLSNKISLDVAVSLNNWSEGPEYDYEPGAGFIPSFEIGINKAFSR
jgi:hypothetical protein